MIKIICVGKIKEKYIKEGIKDYLKRLTKYTKVEIIEVEEQKSLNLESEKIIKQLKENDYIISLQLDGEELNSCQLSAKINNLYIEGKSSIVFIIGSSHGLSESLTSKADYKLSFSTLTFPHQLFRLMFLEQLYRSFKIIYNEKYHK